MMQEDIIRCLKSLDIQQVVYVLSGGGDEGRSDLESIEMKDGSSIYDLPNIVVDFGDNGYIYKLDEEVLSFIQEVPKIDWENNEGGYGNVILNPFAERREDQVECTVEPNEDDPDNDGDDYYDDDDVDDEDGDDQEEDDAHELAASEGDDEDDEHIQLIIQTPVG